MFVHLSIWLPAHLIKEGGCVDLSMNTLHLKYPFYLFGCDGPVLTLPLCLLSPRRVMLCRSLAMTMYHFLVIFYAT